MSNIEGAAKIAADAGMLRGPKGQAVDLLAELRALREAAYSTSKGDSMVNFSVAMSKLFDSVEFLLEQFSK